MFTVKVMFFLLNYRECYDNLCDEPELSLGNRDQEMSEIDVDITPETVDDNSFSSSFHETDSDSDDKDEFGINKRYLTNEIKSEFKRVHVAYVDPVVQKLQSFLNSSILPKESICFIFY